MSRASLASWRERSSSGNWKPPDEFCHHERSEGSAGRHHERSEGSRRLPFARAVATACAPREKTPETPAELMADYVPKLEDALGVKFKTPPKMEVRSRDQVREFLLLKLKEPAIQKQFAEGEAVYKALGLVPDTMNLTDLYVRVLSEQIMGYYDPKTKVLYMVEGAPPDYAGITMMHELVHALQDQYVNLDSIQNLTGSDDRALTLQALIEGQATYQQLYIMSGGNGNIAAQLPGGMDGMRDAIRSAQASQPMFSSAPLVIRETCCSRTSTASTSCARESSCAEALSLRQRAGDERAAHAREAFFGKQRDEPSVVTLPRALGEVTQKISVNSARACSSTPTRAIRTGRFAHPTGGTAIDSRS